VNARLAFILAAAAAFFVLSSLGWGLIVHYVAHCA
jgi:hypothetical protein